MRNILFPVVLLIVSASTLSAQGGSVAVTLEIRGNATTDAPALPTSAVRHEASISSHKVASSTNSAWSLPAASQSAAVPLSLPTGVVFTCVVETVCRMATSGQTTPETAKTASTPAILIIFPDM